MKKIIELNLTDLDLDLMAIKCGKYNVLIEEAIERFVGDIVHCEPLATQYFRNTWREQGSGSESLLQFLLQKDSPMTPEEFLDLVKLNQREVRYKIRKETPPVEYFFDGGKLWNALEERIVNRSKEIEAVFESFGDCDRQLELQLLEEWVAEQEKIKNHKN